MTLDFQAGAILIIAVVAVFFIVVLGWYIVWKFILSQFTFIRELFKSAPENSSVNELKSARSKTRKIRKE
ncbi:hypothetical protein MTP99_007568 [Tenebrio molitor]|jgi:Tfp pilus assembly protein PilO|nr:hypothetical protein MTP99_007568 [Tenebrio molitor]